MARWHILGSGSSWRQENEYIVPLEALDLLARVPVEPFVDTAEHRHSGQHPALL